MIPLTKRDFFPIVCREHYIVHSLNIFFSIRANIFKVFSVNPKTEQDYNKILRLVVGNVEGLKIFYTVDIIHNLLFFFPASCLTLTHILLQFGLGAQILSTLN